MYLQLYLLILVYRYLSECLPVFRYLFTIFQSIHLPIYQSIYLSIYPSIYLSIQAYSCGPQYAAVAFSTVALYTLFTLSVTQWRTQFRVNMNKVNNNIDDQVNSSFKLMVICTKGYQTRLDRRLGKAMHGQVEKIFTDPMPVVGTINPQFR